LVFKLYFVNLVHVEIYAQAFIFQFGEEQDYFGHCEVDSSGEDWHLLLKLLDEVLNDFGFFCLGSDDHAWDVSVFD